MCNCEHANPETGHAEPEVDPEVTLTIYLQRCGGQGFHVTGREKVREGAEGLTNAETLSLHLGIFTGLLREGMTEAAAASMIDALETELRRAAEGGN